MDVCWCWFDCVVGFVLRCGFCYFFLIMIWSFLFKEYFGWFFVGMVMFVGLNVKCSVSVGWFGSCLVFDL